MRAVTLDVLRRTMVRGMATLARDGIEAVGLSETFQRRNES